MEQSLDWDATYAIAKTLIKLYPDVELADVSIQQIFDWVVALPNFEDDPDLVNDQILMAIYQEWYEEINPL